MSWLAQFCIGLVVVIVALIAILIWLGTRRFNTAKKDRVELSPREQQVLSLIAEGKQDKQVAVALGITRSTVKNFGTSIREKLGAQNRTHAVILAIKSGQLKVKGD